MTLIEVMVGIAIVALVATGASYGFNLLNRTNLRSACMRIGAASRFAYHRAITTGSTVRIGLDFGEGTIVLEEARGRVQLVRADDERRRDVEEESGSSASVVDPWEAARANLGDVVRPSFGQTSFGPISNAEGTPIKRYAAQPLGSGVRVMKVFVPHEPEPVSQGKAYIYFFPGGRTERAIVHLTDARGDVFSVLLHPLTGRVDVRSEAYVPPDFGEEQTDEQRSEVEER